MVCLNDRCINEKTPPGTFGGSMCICSKCVEERTNKTDTPRTDEAVLQIAQYVDGIGSIVAANFARQLERELNSLKQQNKLVCESLGASEELERKLDAYFNENHPITSKKIQPINQWISVDDALPNWSETVLVYIPEYKTVTTHTLPDPVPFDTPEDLRNYAMHGATHWMPLPKPPEDE